MFPVSNLSNDWSDLDKDSSNDGNCDISYTNEQSCIGAIIYGEINHAFSAFCSGFNSCFDLSIHREHSDLLHFTAAGDTTATEDISIWFPLQTSSLSYLDILDSDSGPSSTNSIKFYALNGFWVWIYFTMSVMIALYSGIIIMHCHEEYINSCLVADGEFVCSLSNTWSSILPNSTHWGTICQHKTYNAQSAQNSLLQHILQCFADDLCRRGSDTLNVYDNSI